MSEEGAFLFVPVPRCKPVPGQEKHLTAALGDHAAEAIRCSQRTKSACPDEASFQQYMIVLKALGNGSLRSEWMNPFNSREKMESDDARIEFLATVWNYLSVCQCKFLEIDQSSHDALSNGKGLLETLNGLTEVFEFLVKDVAHPVFNQKSAEFLKAYQAYLISLWYLACGKNGKLDLKVITRIGQGCLEQANRVDRTMTACGPDFRSYFKVPVELMRKYFRGFSYFCLGLQKIKEGEHGQAVACMRDGEAAIGVIKSDQCFASHILTSVTMLKANLNSRYTKEKTDNQEVYSQIVPGEVQFPQSPLPFKPIPPKPSIMQFAGDQHGPPAGGYEQIEETLAQNPVFVPSKSPPVFTPSPTPPVFTPLGRTSSEQIGSTGGCLMQHVGTEYSPDAFAAPQQFRPTSNPPVYAPGKSSSGEIGKATSGGPPIFSPGAAVGPPVFAPGKASSGGPPVFTPGASAAVSPDVPQQYQSSTGYPTTEVYQMPYEPVATTGDVPTVEVMPVFSGTSAMGQGMPNPYASATMYGDPFGQQAPPPAPKRLSDEEKQFPMWEIVKSLKEGVSERIADLQVKMPNMSQALNVYAGQVKQAEPIDAHIQSQIDMFINGSAGSSEADINNMIDRAMEFYNALEMKLDQIEGVE